jgi:hypothetical protein
LDLLSIFLCKDQSLAETFTHYFFIHQAAGLERQMKITEDMAVAPFKIGDDEFTLSRESLVAALESDFPVDILRANEDKLIEFFLLPSSLDILESVEKALDHQLVPVRDRIYRHNLEEAMGAETNELRRSRLLVVGQGRAGKSSFLRAIRGQAFDEVSASTVGVDVEEYDVRDIGVSVSSDVAASTMDGKVEWNPASYDANERVRAARANAKH